MQRLLEHAPTAPAEALASMCLDLANALGGTRWCYVVAGRDGPAARAPLRDLMMAGWKTMHIQYDPRCSDGERFAWEQMRERVRFVDDPGGRALIKDIGQRRIQRMKRFYAQHPTAPVPVFLASLGVLDRVIAAAPLGPELELWVIIDRTEGSEFDDDDDDCVARSLTMFAQGAYRLCLHRGWLAHHEPLTPRERETLTHLLAGHSEAQCAQALKLSVGSTHQVVVRIFRKLGVTSRAELMALCLGPVALPDG